jgi:hypothetical protein
MRWETKWVSALENKDLQVFTGGDTRGVLFVSGSSIPTVQGPNAVATELGSSNS